MNAQRGVGPDAGGGQGEPDPRRRQLLDLHRSLENLEGEHRRGLSSSGLPLPPVVRVTRSQASGVLDHLLRTSCGDVLQVTGRGVASGLAHDGAVRRRFEQVMASARVIRTIFPLSVLDDPYRHAVARERASAGEEQRYLPDDAIPVEFGVWGRSGVLLREGGEAEADLLLLRPGSVVDVFVALFEELWRRAEPVLGRDAPVREVRLLELMSLGLKDEALARQLGVSLRTVRRRIAALMDEHEVETRFQLGQAVGGRGLLDGDRR